MSLDWSSGAHASVNTSIGTLAAVGTGSYTLVALVNPAVTAGGAAIGMKVSTGFDVQIIWDTGKFFGGGDFSAGFGTVVAGDWQVIGQSKTSGSNVYRWHYWDYTLAGAKSHADGTGTHANPGAITSVLLGDGDNRNGGQIAAVAVWKRVLSDSEFNSLCTTNLSDWNALAPDALWALNVASPTLVLDATGNGANESSVTGTITGGAADPPGFNYTLTATSSTRPQPLVVTATQRISRGQAITRRGTLQDDPVLTTPQPVVVVGKHQRRPSAIILSRSASLQDQATPPPVVVSAQQPRRASPTAIVVRSSIQDFATPAPVVVSQPAPKRLAPTVVLVRNAAPDVAVTSSTPAPLVVQSRPQTRPAMVLITAGRAGVVAPLPTGPDLDIAVGSPRVAWSVAPIRAAWTADDPAQAWNTSGPRTAWTIGLEQAWTTGRPR